MPRRYRNECYRNVTANGSSAQLSSPKEPKPSEGMLPTGNAKLKSAVRARRQPQFQGFPEAHCLDLGVLAALSSKSHRRRARRLRNQPLAEGGGDGSRTPKPICGGT